MTIRSERAYAVLRFCYPLLPLAAFLLDGSLVIVIYMIAAAVALMIASFTAAFSTYLLDHDGITQKCVIFTRRFAWNEFKFIGVQLLTRGGGKMGHNSLYIRCSTEPLPKLMTAKQFQEKLYWRPSKTITIAWPEKGGEEMYRKFLTFCGGERDIRE